MKEISKYLIHFINKEFLNKPSIITKNNNIQFSIHSIQFLQNIYQNIINANMEWKHYKDKITETIIDCNNKLPKGNFYDNICHEIKTLIQKQYKIGRKYTFKINTQTICVNLVLPLHNDNVNKISEKNISNYFRNCLHKIFCWLYIGNIYKPSQCSQVITIYIYLTDHFKVLSKSDSTLHEINSNSALTTSCNYNTNIHLYREEEWFKVLIHETFHCFGLDFSGENNNDANVEILKMFPVKSEVNIFETYCEMFAEIINILFYIYFSNTHKKKLSINKFRELIQYERIFSCFQCAKVISFYNLTYDTMTNNISHSKVKLNYKETTNILSYYIIKSIMMFYINEYIEWVSLHNKGSLSFIKTNDNILKYCGFVKEHYKLFEYTSTIDYFEKWFLRNKYSNTLETNTMRMSVVEFV